MKNLVKSNKRDISAYTVEELNKMSLAELGKLIDDDFQLFEKKVMKGKHKAWELYSWNCFESVFADKTNFDDFIKNLSVEKKTKFLWLSAFWNLLGDNYKGPYPSAVKLLVIILVIDGLFDEDDYVDFYEWLSAEEIEKKMQEGKLMKVCIEELKTEWKNTYGNADNFRKFFKDCLSSSDQNTLMSRIEIKVNGQPGFRALRNPDELASLFIKLRGVIIHKARLATVFLDNTSTASSSMARIEKNYFLKSSLHFDVIEAVIKRGFKTFFNKDL